jgi:hypothetical protein
MSLFGFGNIIFDKSNGDRTKGPLAALENNQFEKTRLRYPIDLGQTDKAHYLVFYIREQNKTSFGSGVATQNALESATKDQVAAGKAQIMGSIQKAKDAVNQVKTGFASDILDKLNGISSQGGIAGALSKVTGNVIGGINNVFGSTSVTFGGNSQATEDQIQTSIKKITGLNNGISQFLRTTRLTKDTIALYMPDTLQYGYSQSYDQLALGGEVGGKIMAAGGSIVQDYKNAGGGMAGIGAATKGAAGKGAELAGQAAAKKLGESTIGAQSTQALLATTGRVENPMLEMIYKSPAFRKFQFDFTFYPRDEREALEVQKIIKKFVFHQAPETYKGLGGSNSGFLVPPSEFDVQFYYNGAQNPNIPTVGTCILENVQVNYAPNGFTAYEIPGENAPALGRTGMPVAIQITLQFTEVVIVTKNDLVDASPNPGKPDKQSGGSGTSFGGVGQQISDIIGA